jgi:hypothetical protein
VSTICRQMSRFKQRSNTCPVSNKPLQHRIHLTRSIMICRFRRLILFWSHSRCLWSTNLTGTVYRSAGHPTAECRYRDPSPVMLAVATCRIPIFNRSHRPTAAGPARHHNVINKTQCNSTMFCTPVMRAGSGRLRNPVICFGSNVKNLEHAYRTHLLTQNLVLCNEGSQLRH